MNSLNQKSEPLVATSAADAQKLSGDAAKNEIMSKIASDGMPKGVVEGEPDMTPLHVDRRYKTRILLVRHGESEANAIRVFLGHTDLGLSPRGVIQAEATAEFLANEPIDVIYSSDLLRAYNTAVPNAERHRLDIIPSRELREIHIGDWENNKIDDIEREWGEEFTVGWKQNFGMFTPPNGESVEGAGRRFYAEVMRIAKENQGKCILITAHAAVIRIFYAIISGVPMNRVVEDVPFPDNASVTTVYYDGGELIPGEFSHSVHLIGT